MTKYTCFDVSVKDHIAHVVMNRPDEFNTMTRLFWKELPEIVKDLDKNAEARVILLTGEGKHFNAGMDLANFAPSR
jgi:enoyl-CoA hydratase